MFNRLGPFLHVMFVVLCSSHDFLATVEIGVLSLFLSSEVMVSYISSTSCALPNHEEDGTAEFACKPISISFIIMMVKNNRVQVCSDHHHPVRATNHTHLTKSACTITPLQLHPSNGLHHLSPAAVWTNCNSSSS